MRIKTLALTAALSAMAFSGCRGWTSPNPPVHLNPNMDTQEKLKPYRAESFFKNGAAMRTPIVGTVGRSISGKADIDGALLGEDSHYYTGKLNGQVPNAMPANLVVDDALLARGQERYNIYCAPCHAEHGTGEGTVASRLQIKPPTFHDDLRYKMDLSHVFRVITHGKPLPEDMDEGGKLNMPSYAAQIDTKDRWAIVAYVRALQHLRHPGALAVGGLSFAPGDADSDSVLDENDKCPNEKETINGFEDEDGCPDEGESHVKLTDTSLVILDKVYFATGSAKIKPKSFSLLNEVAAVVRATPAIKGIRVEGHTDNQGKAASNLKLSQARADSVRTYLIGHGVKEEVLKAQGFGQTKPVDSNDTKAGRENNRRVEFQITERD